MENESVSKWEKCKRISFLLWVVVKWWVKTHIIWTGWICLLIYIFIGNLHTKDYPPFVMFRSCLVWFITSLVVVGIWRGVTWSHNDRLSRASGHGYRLRRELDRQVKKKYGYDLGLTDLGSSSDESDK